MRKLISMLFIGLFALTILAQDLEMKISELSDNFKKYARNIERGKENSSYGYFPSPLKMNAGIPKSFSLSREIPVFFDLRENGYVSNVKDQGTLGACWCFATTAALESRWLQLDEAEFDLSERNILSNHGFELGENDGGNSQMSTAYLSRGIGPISESDDPYFREGSLLPIAFSGDARFFISSPTNIVSQDEIKQMIMDYGALFTAMNWDVSSFDTNNSTYYYAEDEPVNHAVNIIGWDNSLETAGGTGAWICKNSWGEDWGDNGYFYVSYNDTKINSEMTFWPKRTDYINNSKTYYHDKLGATGSLGLSELESVQAMVKFTAEDDLIINRVGSWMISNDSFVTFKIYKNFNGISLNSSDLLLETDRISCDFAGYYSIPLESDISIKEGENYFVFAFYETPGFPYPIPIESTISSPINYANPEFVYDCEWVTAPGYNWTKLTNENHFDLCIKAYTVSDFVWPGDADDNGIVNAEDILSIGAFWNETGNARNTPSIKWESHIIPSDWEISYAAYADCNGDGKVGISDVLAICVNWQKSHGSSYNKSININYVEKENQFKEIFQLLGDSEPEIAMKTTIANIYGWNFPQIEKNISLSNFPNPFNPTTKISYSILEKGNIEIAIFNVKGQQVYSFSKNHSESGNYNFIWEAKDSNGKNLSSGLYFYKMKLNGKNIATDKMLLLK